MSEAEEPVAPAEPPGRARRWQLALLIAGLGAAISVAVVVTHVRRPRAVAAAVTASRGDGGVAIRAPEGPHVPGDRDGTNLAGFVVDGAGLPVEGAEVSAEAEHAGGVAVAASDPAAPHPAMPTGADGRFVIAGLAPGRYRLRVVGHDLVPAEVRFVPVPSDATQIVVAREVLIDGVITDGGKPAPNVQVGLRGDAIGGSIEVRSDLTGAFRFPQLPEGRYQVFAWHGALAARTVRVNRLGRGPFAPVELRLEIASIVIGRVIDREEGTGLVAAIELRPSGDDQAPRYARSAEDGTFRIEGVPTGTWIADAFAPGYLSPGGVELEAGHGIPELALARAGMIEGRVVDGEGHPIAGAAVRALTSGANPIEVSAAIDQDRLRRFSGRTAAPLGATAPTGPDPQLIARGELGVLVGPIPPIPPPGAQVARPTASDPALAGAAGEPAPLPADPTRDSIWVTGSDGRYRIRGLAKGKVAVLAAAPSFAEGRSKALVIDAGQALTAIDVVLTSGQIVVGKIIDQHRVPVIGARITAAPELGLPLEAFSDELGEYRLGPISGTVVLHATAFGHGDATRTVQLVAGRGATASERREDLVLEVADAVLAGIVDDAAGAPVAGAHLEVIGGPAEGRQATAAPDGTFAIDLLPAGHLRVRISHPAYPVEELDAVATPGAGAHVRLRLPIGGAIEGAVLDGSSGAPLTSITIAGAGPDAATIEGTTDKAGRWKLGPLAPGHWTLTVALPGYLPLSRAVDVSAARSPGETTLRDLRLELARGALIGGTVRDARGRRLGGAKVVAQLASGASATVEGSTDSEGEFRIHDVPTGILVISASSGDLGGSVRVTLRPGDEILGLSLELR